MGKYHLHRDIPPNLPSGLLQDIDPPACDKHLGAIYAERLGDSLADATAAPGHHDHLAFDGKHVC